MRSNAVLSSLLSLSTLILPVVSRRSPPEYGPWVAYVTEPELEPYPFDIKNITDDTSRLSKDYFIYSVTSHGGPPPWGPQIHDWQGNLILYGAGLVPGSQDPHVCDFKGQTGQHLCGNEVNFKPGIGMELTPGLVTGSKMVVDETYTLVAEYGQAGDLGIPNNHDFNMLPGGESFLQPVYEHKTMDLRPYGGSKEGGVSDGCFQEINVRTRGVMFRWCYLDHYEIWNTYIFLDVPGNKVNLTSHIAGKGEQYSPWDFLHVNSVDKNEDGDYLFSARHMNQAIKIAGNNNKYGLKPGETIWRLNGKNGNVKMIDEFFFSRQHHTRFVNKTGHEQTISLFNNAWEGRNDPTADFSTAEFIRVDEQAMTATLIADYRQPEGALAAAQGSVQVLSNDNVLVGWGARRQITEFAPDGEVLFHAHLSEINGQDVYRASKQPWVGKPKWPPKLIAYTHTCSSTGTEDPLMVYASWNGATEYTQWRFSTSTTNRDGPWVLSDTVPRDGFETKHRLLAANDPFVRFVKAEALDKDGNVLSQVVSETWVPHQRFLEHCLWDYCHQPARFVYKSEFSKAGECQSKPDATLGSNPENPPQMDSPTLGDDTASDDSPWVAPTPVLPDLSAPTPFIATPIPGHIATDSSSPLDDISLPFGDTIPPRYMGLFAILFGLESVNYISRIILRLFFL